MKLPNNYNKLMAIMYDKEFELYKPVEEIDEELNSIIKKGAFVEKVKCNTHFTSKDAVLRDFGLNLETSLYFTCESTKAKENDFITYNGVDYVVKGVLKYDTHVKVFVHEQ